MILDKIKTIAKQVDLFVMLSRRYRQWQRRRGKTYPNWRAVSGSANEYDQAKTGQVKKILIATSTGAHIPSFTLESLLGFALNMRGAHAEILLCDEVLTACLDCEYIKFPTLGMQKVLIAKGPKSLCVSCYKPAVDSLKGTALHVRRYGESISNEKRAWAKEVAEAIPFENIRKYRFEGAAVGEHAYAGALRFFGRGDLDCLEHGEPILRRYLESALITAAAVSRLIEESRYDVIVLNHGIYIPQGIIAEVARQAGVQVITWNPGYRRNCFLFSHGDTYHHTMMTEPVNHWENIEWSKRIENVTMNYLKSRWTGSQDWIWFHERPYFNVKDIEKETGVDFSKPCIGMLTNVIWDAQLHYPANAFDNMMEWVLDTIEYFSNRPNIQLLIRVHPAEIRGGVPSRQKVVDEIAKRFSTLPQNVFVIPPESHISTYAAMMKCNSVLIYGTKTGVELTSIGIPVVVAGEAWIRNKGLTIDVTSREKYHESLDCLPLEQGLSEDVITRARKYAFHFFYRRMIPLNVVKPTEGMPPYRIAINSLEELNPGKDPGLDIICKGILTGSEFIYPAEKIEDEHWREDAVH